MVRELGPISLHSMLAASSWEHPAMLLTHARPPPQEAIGLHGWEQHLGWGTVGQGANTGRGNAGRRTGGTVGSWDLLSGSPYQHQAIAVPLACLPGCGDRIPGAPSATPSVCLQPPEEALECHFISHWFTWGWVAWLGVFSFFFLSESPSCRCSFQLDVAMGCRSLSRQRGLQLSIASETSLLPAHQTLSSALCPGIPKTKQPASRSPY